MVFITSFCDLMITYYNYAFLKIHTKKPPNFFCKYKREQSCDRGFRKWAYVFYINVGRAFYKPPKRKNLWSHGQQESGGRLFPRGSETGCVLFRGVRYAGSSSHALRTGRYLKLSVLELDMDEWIPLFCTNFYHIYC